jgi:hypothetical protein
MTNSRRNFYVTFDIKFMRRIFVITLCRNMHFNFFGFFLISRAAFLFSDNSLIYVVFCIFDTQRAHEVCVMLTINRDYFPEQH